MRWDRGHNSPNVEDHRGEGGGGGMGGLGLLLPLAGRFGWKGILIALVVLGLLRYGNCGGAMCSGGAADDGERRPGATSGAGAKKSDDELFRFVGFVLDDAQAFWQEEFKGAGERYRNARLSVFTDSVRSGCGNASSAVGPFYCPVDQKVYIDLSFYRELQRRFGAPGDFAQAYVIAHEIGHHVQRLRGVLGGDEGNKGSIKTELQADCLAGVWAKSAEKRNMLEAGDLSEGMTAAAAVGDDAIQKKSGGEITPETWTHGSSDQRQAAFQRGYDGGRMKSCGL
ncbi:MAG TPA: neutral zinc metallopeptidase [Kofleriaceae bacterium]|nr:neutral zinc metallopeptidase [Kofleriaceae bacterium]